MNDARCAMTAWWILSDGTATARQRCDAPATVRRHMDTSQPVPRIETDQVCEEHWLMMYRCQNCGAIKGTWRAPWCRACLKEPEEIGR